MEIIFQFVIDFLQVLPATILAGAAFYQAWKAHKAVNSRMTELIEITRRDATLVEKDAERVRKKRRSK